MRNFIFITNEGNTYQPNSENPEPDIENCQVIGFACGSDEEEAFGNLVRENEYLLATNFNEVTCLELARAPHGGGTGYFRLDAFR